MQLTYEETMNRGKGTCTYCGSEIMYTVPDHDDPRFGIVVYRCYSKLDTNPYATNQYHTTMSNKCKALVDGTSLAGMPLTAQTKTYVPTATRPTTDEFNDTKPLRQDRCPRCDAAFSSEYSTKSVMRYGCGRRVVDKDPHTHKIYPECSDRRLVQNFVKTLSNECKWCGAGLTGTAIVNSRITHQVFSCGSWYDNAGILEHRSQTCLDARLSEVGQSNLRKAVEDAISIMPKDPAEALRILRLGVSNEYT